MPRRKSDYSKTKIYRLDVGDEFYVGSTVQTLKKRLFLHDCNQKKNKILIYVKYHQVGSWKMTLLEAYSCKNRKEQMIWEQYWMDKLKPTLNMNRANGNIEYSKDKMNAWRKRNSEKLKVRHRIFYHKNKNEIRAKRKISCIACGIPSNYNHWKRHCKTQKHLHNIS